MGNKARMQQDIQATETTSPLFAKTLETQASVVLPQLRQIAYALPTNAAVLDILHTRDKSLESFAYLLYVFELYNTTPYFTIHDDAPLTLDLWQVALGDIHGIWRRQSSSGVRDVVFLCECVIPLTRCGG